MRLKIAIIAVCAILSACQSEPKVEETPTTLRLSGSVKNPAEMTVIISHLKNKDTLTVQEDGSFSGVIELLEEGRLSLKMGGESTAFYAAPGDSLNISFDFNEFDESMSYEGTSPGSSRYLASLYLKNEAINENYQVNQLYLLSPVDFTRVTDSLTQERSSLLEKFKGEIHSELYSAEKNAQLYSWARSYKIYPEYAAWFQKNDSIEMPEDFMAPISGVAFENSSALEVPEYQGYVEQELQAEVNRRFEARAHEAEDMDYINEMLVCVDSMLVDKAVKEHFLKSTMLMAIDYFGTKDLKEQFDFFKSKSTNTDDLASLQEEYKTWESLQKGKKAPEFAYKTVNGELIQLSDFLGKLVYIDVWATWCGPCRGEIPSLQALEEEMKEEDVVFLSVSVDDSYADWETMVTEDGLGGTQVITGSGWKSKITEDYKISGIPRFMLIDREGNIVSADAPRPSDAEGIKAMMMEALNNTNALAVK